MSDDLVTRLRYCASIAKPTDDGMLYGLAGLCIEAAKEIERLRSERNQLHDALNTAGGALHRMTPFCIEDDEARADNMRWRIVGLAAVEFVLRARGGETT